MLELEQQGIKRALVDSQKVSADLLDAPGDTPAVLRSQDIQCLEDHQCQRSLQDVGFFLHRRSTFRFPTGIMARSFWKATGDLACLVDPISSVDSGHVLSWAKASLQFADSRNERYEWPIPGCFWLMMTKLRARV